MTAAVGALGTEGLSRGSNSARDWGRFVSVSDFRCCLGPKGKVASEGLWVNSLRAPKTRGAGHSTLLRPGESLPVSTCRRRGQQGTRAQAGCWQAPSVLAGGSLVVPILLRPAFSFLHRIPLPSQQRACAQVDVARVRVCESCGPARIASSFLWGPGLCSNIGTDSRGP